MGKKKLFKWLKIDTVTCLCAEFDFCRRSQVLKCEARNKIEREELFNGSEREREKFSED